MTKPSVPESIARSYEEREVERTKLLIRKEEQKLREKCTKYLIFKNLKSKRRCQKCQPRPKTSFPRFPTESISQPRKPTRRSLLSRTKSSLWGKLPTQRANYVHLLSILDRQNKLIELNRQKLIPQKLLANSFINIKNANKTVYSQSLEAYLDTANKLLKQTKSNWNDSWLPHLHLSNTHKNDQGDNL